MYWFCLYKNVRRDVSFSVFENTSSVWVLSVAFEWFGMAAMFQLGNSNSTATIDISGAYTGLDAYHRPLVAAFVWLIVYSGPALHFLALLAHVAAQRARALRALSAELALLAGARHALTAGVFSVVCVALRHHLFVWSVVSPKYLYLLGAASLALAQSAALLLVRALAAREKELLKTR